MYREWLLTTSRSPLIADPIQNHWLGRRGAVAASAAVSTVATVGVLCSRTIAQLIGCRILIGASLGAKASVIAPLLAELAPVHLRGALLSTW
jgi:MFS family permease